jgi:hypothetical protein
LLADPHLFRQFSQSARKEIRLPAKIDLRGQETAAEEKLPAKSFTGRVIAGR